MNRETDQTRYVYILTNKGNSVLYVGATGDLVKRSYYHKRKYLNGFTKRYNLNKLVYYECFPDIKSAKVREHEMKGWKRKKKIRLIESMNPNWEDLYNGLREILQPFGLQDDQSEKKRKNTPTGQFN